jgi:hypothetical protein
MAGTSPEGWGPALVAQWIEHLTSDQTVARSNRAEGALGVGVQAPFPRYRAVFNPVLLSLAGLRSSGSGIRHPKPAFNPRSLL